MAYSMLRKLLLALCLIVCTAAREYPASPAANHDLLEAIVLHNSTKYSSLVPLETLELLREAACRYPKSRFRRIAQEVDDDDDDDRSSDGDRSIEDACPVDETPAKDCTEAFRLMGASTRPLADDKSSRRWRRTYLENLERMADFKCKPGIVWYGDSIVEYWGGKRDKTWKRHYGDTDDYKATWAGIAGDTTANLLWRMQHGELDHVNPSALVIHIGINDVMDILEEDDLDSDMETASAAISIAQTMETILGTIRLRWCNRPIVLVSLLTASFEKDERSYKWPNGHTRLIEMVNFLYKLLADENAGVYYANCHWQFLERKDDEYRIDPDLMPDSVHPSDDGYNTMARCVNDLLQGILD